MANIFSGLNADDVWKTAVSKLLEHSRLERNEFVASRAGDTIELLHSMFSISEPRQRWVVARRPFMSISFSLAEVIWILNGTNESRIINYWNPVLPKFAGKYEQYPGAYGYRLRYGFGQNQLEAAFHALKSNPTNRQTVLLIWDPNKDLPNHNGEPISQDIPCNICSMLKIRNKKLYWTQVLRSNDIFLGVPYNFIQFTTLQEILAGWLGIDVGEYVQYSDSLHLYSSSLRKMKMSEDVLAWENTDELKLSFEDTYKTVTLMYDIMDSISNANIPEVQMNERVQIIPAGTAYGNIMRIIGAYAARKHNYSNLEAFFISQNTNKIFTNIWHGWTSQ